MRPSPERLVIETMLRIPNKDGLDVDFRLNVDQARFDAQKTGRDIIAKYRQGGFSTYPLGCALVNCLGHRNRRHVIIAHNSDTTQKLLARVHYMIKHFKGPAPDLKHSTQNRIVFNKTDSSIFIGTAGSDDYGVGDTITDLHCSEVSRWNNPQSLLTGLFQAVPPSGRVVLESTGKGAGNWFHQAVIRASNGVGYKLHFFSWLNTPEYQLPFSGREEEEFLHSLDPTIEEDKYHALGLTVGQLAWRRLKLGELNYDTRLFKENYPVSLEECFQSTGFGLFSEVNYRPAADWKARDPWTMVLGDHPKPRRAYVAGADPSGGVGKDYSVLEIFDVVTGEQVLEYRNNMIQPDRFAVKVKSLLHEFNNAFINPERNNHGYAFISKLLDLSYPTNLIHRAKISTSATSVSNELRAISDFGTYTTETMKSLMISSIRQQLRSEALIHSETLKLELASFVELENGSMGAEVGCFDDTVMATALALHVRPRVALSVLQTEDVERRRFESGLGRQFAAGQLLAELEDRWRDRGGCPIASQVE